MLHSIHAHTPFVKTMDIAHLGGKSFKLKGGSKWSLLYREIVSSFVQRKLQKTYELSQVSSFSPVIKRGSVPIFTE